MRCRRSMLSIKGLRPAKRCCNVDFARVRGVAKARSLSSSGPSPAIHSCAESDAAAIALSAMSTPFHEIRWAITSATKSFSAPRRARTFSRAVESAWNLVVLINS